MICQCVTPQEARKKSFDAQQETREANKTRRRQEIIAAVSQSSDRTSNHDDPWANWKSRPAPKTTPRNAPTVRPNDTVVEELQKQVSTMSARLDKHESRMDAMDATLAGNHTEVMSMLRAIAGSIQELQELRLVPSEHQTFRVRHLKR